MKKKPTNKAKLRYGMQTIFTTEQMETINCCIRKHSSVLLAQKGSHIVLLYKHHKYLRPVAQAVTVKLFKGELREKTPYLYLYDSLPGF